MLNEWSRDEIILEIKTKGDDEANKSNNEKKATSTPATPEGKKRRFYAVAKGKWVKSVGVYSDDFPSAYMIGFSVTAHQRFNTVEEA